MSRTIRVDDDVFAALQERAVPLVDTPNSVLRKLLGLDPDPTVTGDDEDDATALTVPRLAGRDKRLAAYLETGVLKPGDRLVWHRRNHRTTYYATVLADGNLRVELPDEPARTYGSPSAAASDLAGNPQNGLKVWRLGAADGPTLDELRP
ncbi:hypothetical protein LO772_31545 [Yinghuangia sp. ASG 101]|uniref:restriction system modified-DNA reader domain-containing protein n=1 Tax=Yinghuangia sp. ASG 101 TaxID=2896848 RepID=UPI001E5A9FEF|nr:hypothetical protein [Yinghuangia sp. ASG 101]UGQ11287.1 hypothetical protein LO772_31545 [Yinghuangia sp. ASG 101]